MQNEEKFTIKDLKIIFNNIIKKESKENDITINGNLYTIVEYYQSEIFKKNLKLYKPITSLKKIIDPLTSKGWYDPTKKFLIVFINSLYERCELINTEELANILLVIYHEIQHRIKDERTKKYTAYANFITLIEKIILQNDHLFYRINHDSFFIEIDADTKAIEKTINFLRKNQIIDEKNQQYLNRVNEKNQSDIMFYNPINNFEKFNSILQKQINSTNSPEKLTNSIKIISQNLDEKEINAIQKILCCIYNQDGTFKSLQELLLETNKMDIKIINLIIESPSFIKKLNITTLNKEEKEYLLQILKKLYNEEKTRITYVKEKIKDDITLLDYKKYNLRKANKKLKELQEKINLLTNKIESETNINYYKKIYKK